MLDVAAQTQEVTVDIGTDAVAAAANRNRDAVVMDDKELRNLPIFDRDIVGTLSRFLDASAMGSGGATLIVDRARRLPHGPDQRAPQGVARNALQGPSYARLDLRWSHEFTLGSGKGDDAPAWTVGLDAFNVVNHVNYAGFIGTETSPFFGRAIAAQPPRRLQLSAGVHF